MNNNPLSNAKIVGENVDQRVYHALTQSKRGESDFRMSASELKEFLDCPKEWVAGIEDEGTRSTDFGNAVDCLLLTPDQWSKNFFVTPLTYPDKKTGEPKAWTRKSDYCKEYEAENGAGKQILKPEDFANGDPVLQKALELLKP